MRFRIFKLHFKTPIHIGTNSPSLSSSDIIIHSDTLFSAIMNCWAKLYPEDMEKFFEDGSGDFMPFPFFRISSAFPFYEERFFFPRPINVVVENSGLLANEEIKKFKKARFVEKEVFEAAISKGYLSRGEFKFCNRNPLFLVSDEGIPDDLITTHDVVRVRKDFITKHTEPFYFTRVYFNDRGGLFFLVEFIVEGMARKFSAVMNLLGDTGIGGDRSDGNGLFEASEEILKLKLPDLKVPDEAEKEEGMRIETELGPLILPAIKKGMVTLSLYNPGPLFSRYSWTGKYEIVQRRGWIFSGRATGLRRSAVNMFVEGSFFSIGDGKELRGFLVKVSDPVPEMGLTHPVYRYGVPFGMPAKALAWEKLYRVKNGTSLYDKEKEKKKEKDGDKCEDDILF